MTKITLMALALAALCFIPWVGNALLQFGKEVGHSLHQAINAHMARTGLMLFVGNPTSETMDLMKGALSKSSDDIAKTVSVGTGLVPFDLQAPAKNLYPVNTPIRNRLPRVGGGVGTATNWKTIKAIVGSGFDAMGWVPEGQRTGRMSYSVNDVAASYRTIGEEDQVTFEAVSAGRTFEDVRSTASMRVLQKMMLKEENALLMGNLDGVALGTPATPTLAAAGSGATLPALTYSVIVVALTGEGYRGASLAAGVPTSLTVTGADGQTFTLNGGSSNKSAAATQAVTLGQTLSCSTTAIPGALGYAWYTGAAGSEKLEAITTINSVTFAVPLLGTGQTAASIASTDKSQNSLGFNGLLYSAFKSGSGAYVKTMATGTAGTGTGLTASSRGTINEIDVMLKSMWDQYQISPTVIYVNSQELQNITNKAMAPGSSPLLQIFAKPEDGFANMMAGGVVGWYFNPFAMDGGIKIPIKLHPSLPAGTIICWCENLPAQYSSNHVPNVAEVKTRVDYYQIDWPLRTRAQEFGVYAEEVLAVYVPFAMGVITNIANT